MKILAFSDIHCSLEGAKRLSELAEQADVVIGAGDFASVHKGLEETITALGKIDRPSVVVPGNNETVDALRETVHLWPSATVLHGESKEISGVTFFGLGGGIPTTPWEWSFDLTEAEAEEKLESCPEGAVLVVHSPPKGYLDGHGTSFGSQSILTTIETKHPPLAVCGHIHECWEEEAHINGTQLLNAGPKGRLVEI